jgi:hypothetical protein
MFFCLLILTLFFVVSEDKLTVTTADTSYNCTLTLQALDLRGEQKNIFFIVKILLATNLLYSNKTVLKECDFIMTNSGRFSMTKQKWYARIVNTSQNRKDTSKLSGKI